MSNRTHILALALALLSSIASADYQFKSKFGYDLHTLKANPHSSMGWIAGGRYSVYFGSSSVSLGFAGYYGSPTGGNVANEYMTYGGILLSWEFKFKRTVVYELDLLTGIGEGQFKDQSVFEKSFYTLQPSASIGVNLGGGWRLSGVLTYLHMSRANQFCGPSIGFRFDYRASNASKQANEF